MVNVALFVIPEPKPGTRTVLASNPTAPPGPLIANGGDNTFICGECGFTLAEHVEGGQVQNVVLKCPRCDSYNETRT